MVERLVRERRLERCRPPQRAPRVVDREQVRDDADVGAGELVEHRLRDGRPRRLVERQLHVPDAHEPLVGHAEHGAPACLDVVDGPQLDVTATAELLQRLAHAGAPHRLEVHAVAVVGHDERVALLVHALPSRSRAGT